MACMRCTCVIFTVLLVTILGAVPLFFVPSHQQRLCPRDADLTPFERFKNQIGDHALTETITEAYARLYTAVLKRDLDISGNQCSPIGNDPEEDLVVEKFAEASNDEKPEVPLEEATSQDTNKVDQTTPKAEEASHETEDNEAAENSALNNDESATEAHKRSTEGNEIPESEAVDAIGVSDIAGASLQGEETNKQQTQNSTNGDADNDEKASASENEDQNNVTESFTVGEDSSIKNEEFDFPRAFDTSADAVSNALELQSIVNPENQVTLESIRANIVNSHNETDWTNICGKLKLKPRKVGLRKVLLGVAIESSSDLAVLPILVHEVLPLVEKIIIAEGSSSSGSSDEAGPNVLAHWPRLGQLYPQIQIVRVNFGALMLESNDETSLNATTQATLGYNRKKALWNGLKKGLLEQADETSGFILLKGNEVVRREAVQASVGCGVSLPVHYSMKSYRYSLRWLEEGTWLHPEMVSYLTLKKKDPFTIRHSRSQANKAPEEGLSAIDSLTADTQTSLSIGGSSVQNSGWKMRLFGGVPIVARSISQRLLPANKSDDTIDKIELRAAVAVRSGADILVALKITPSELQANASKVHENVVKALETNEQGQYIVTGWKGLEDPSVDLPRLIKESASRWLHMLDPFG